MICSPAVTGDAFLERKTMTTKHQWRRAIASVGFVLAMVQGARAQTVTVSPTSVSVPIEGSRQLTAYVNGAPTTAVAWTVDGIMGGN